MSYITYTTYHHIYFWGSCSKPLQRFWGTRKIRNRIYQCRHSAGLSTIDWLPQSNLSVTEWISVLSCAPLPQGVTGVTVNNIVCKYDYNVYKCQTMHCYWSFLTRFQWYSKGYNNDSKNSVCYFVPKLDRAALAFFLIIITVQESVSNT